MEITPLGLSRFMVTRSIILHSTGEVGNRTILIVIRNTDTARICYTNQYVAKNTDTLL